MAPPPAIDEDPVGRYLREQRELRTPVVRFAEDHAAGSRVQARFRELLPLTAPAAGEQFAFEVDLDACSGCKSCVAACHSQNGLDEGEWWREVQSVCGGTPEAPFAQFVTAACHHCESPGCLEGCPVLAYEKDSVTGIVRHLDDQCIGCQYCVWTCPYEAPKFNERLGIVRKCDLCQQRLSHGEAPACAQACPTDAIRVVKVARGAGSDAFFSSEPDPAQTQPTTRYVTERSLPRNLRLAAAEAPAAQPAHRPLGVMLVLMQVAVGITAAAAVTGDSITGLLLALGLLGTGLAIGTFHLGQPSRAWRAMLNLRHSWFSREVLAFLLYACALAAAATGAALNAPWAGAAAQLGVIVGLLGISASVALYTVTRRSSWSLPRTAVRFFGTAGLGLVAGLWSRHEAPAWALGIATALKLLLEAETLCPAHPQSDPSLARTVRILRGPLRAAVAARVALAVGAILLVSADIPLLALGALGAGELLERELFFRSVAPPNPAHRERISR